MDYAETDEQQMIRELVRDFAESVLAPTVEHRDQNQIPPSAEWQEFLNLVYKGVTIPEQYGGSPVDDVSESIIVEELARIDPSFAVMYCVHVGLCAKTIALHGNEAQKEQYLTRLAAGDVGAYSLSEAGAGTDAAAMICKAKLSDDGKHYLLNGEKMWVMNGAQAQIIVLLPKMLTTQIMASRSTAVLLHSSSIHRLKGSPLERKKINWEYVHQTHAH